MAIVRFIHSWIPERMIKDPDKRHLVRAGYEIKGCPEKM